MNFRSGLGTGVSSRRYDSFRYDIFWWYHVNERRATRGNRSELDPQRKSLESDIMQTAPNFVLSCGFAIAISILLLFNMSDLGRWIEGYKFIVK